MRLPSTPLCYSFNVAQQEDQGEDADPVLTIAPGGDAGLLAVFDGMGGAGAARYDCGGVARTGAYLASRLASAVVTRVVDESGILGGALVPVEAFAADLEQQLTSEFREKVHELEDGTPRRLGGTIVRRLPTTLTALLFTATDDASMSYTALWAGDSRAYLLTPAAGLQQVSVDDIRSNGDALQNLLEDSPISNCIDADTAFAIRSFSGSCALPCVLLVATDGCFNYGTSPAHFEHALLGTLQDASSAGQWRDRVLDRQTAIAGDDLSMALAAVGWESFDRLKCAFAARTMIVAKQFVSPIDALDQQLAQLTREQHDAAQQREALRQQLWERYRTEYERLHVRPQPEARS